MYLLKFFFALKKKGKHTACIWAKKTSISCIPIANHHLVHQVEVLLLTMSQLYLVSMTVSQHAHYKDPETGHLSGITPESAVKRVRLVVIKKQTISSFRCSDASLGQVVTKAVSLIRKHFWVSI